MRLKLIIFLRRLDNFNDGKLNFVGKCLKENVNY